MMDKFHPKYFPIQLLGLVLFAFGCTESPFNNTKIQSRNLSISGEIVLSGQDDPANVYIWIQGTPLSTRTDQNGQYHFTLPSTSNGLYDSISGSFNLLFYIANYRFASAEVVIQNGQFLYSHGDVDPDGQLLRPKSLLKMLAIETKVSPSAVSSNYDGLINVDVSLWALGDSVTVIFPKVIGGNLGAMLLHHLDSDAVFAEIPDIDVQTKVVAKIGEEKRNWQMVFNLKPGTLPNGKYEIIPYILIEQKDLPQGILESLGERVQDFGPNYLKIPFKRKGGWFEIKLAN